MSVTTKMTSEQYFELGEDTDGVRRELLDGEVVVSPYANLEHARVITELVFQLHAFVKPRKLGTVVCDVDTQISEHDVPRPDVLYFTTAQEKFFDWQRSNTVPELAVEVLSPSNARTDRKYKFELYARGEIPCYWIIDPRQRTLQAYQSAAGEYQLVVEGRDDQIISAPPLPELKIELAELWWRGSK